MNTISNYHRGRGLKRLHASVACLIAVTLIGTSFVSGCRQETGPETPATTLPVEEVTPGEQTTEPATEKPPEIPPLSTFIIDFDDFLSPEPSSSGLEGSEQSWQYLAYSPQVSDLFADNLYAPDEQKNWGFAALNAGFWNIVLFVGLVVPVAAFIESFEHTPEQQPDYTWIWSYEVSVDDDIYTAELHGRFIDSGVRWEMYVSKDGEYDNFQWYYGESNLPATEGFWILKKNASDPTELLRIDWHRAITDGSSDSKYTNIVPGGPENGGYILHKVTNESPYDRSYEIYNKGKDNTTNIEWNSSTMEGRVKDSAHFGNGDWHCWDFDLQDIECP
jgi:hypothetical protein